MKRRYFLPFELDLFRNCAPIGMGCGLRAEQVSHGLLLLWEHVWRTKNDRVTTGHLTAFFFGVHPCEPLMTFGVLEATTGGWRVKGAAEWLRVMSAQSEAGKAHSGNLQRGRKSSGSPPASATKSAEAGDKPVGSPPALPATTHQPPPTSKRSPPIPPKPDPRHAPLVLALCAASPAYSFDGGRDARAVTALLGRGDPAEVERRWRRALARDGYPTVRTLSELVTHWNHFAADGPSKPAGKGPVDPSTQKHVEGRLAL